MSKKRRSNSTNPAPRKAPPMTAEETLAAAAMKDSLVAASRQPVTYDEDGVAIIPSKRHTPAGQFRFRVEGDDRTYSLPKLQHLDVELALRLEEPGMSEEKLTGLIFARYAPDLLGRVDAAELGIIANAWREDSKQGLGSPVGLGESSPSS